MGVVRLVELPTRWDLERAAVRWAVWQGRQQGKRIGRPGGTSSLCDARLVEVEGARRAGSWSSVLTPHAVP